MVLTLPISRPSRKSRIARAHPETPQGRPPDEDDRP
jgi:hypothetical protein